jgi:hypothetical protein
MSTGQARERASWSRHGRKRGKRSPRHPGAARGSRATAEGTSARDEGPRGLRTPKRSRSSPPRANGSSPRAERNSPRADPAHHGPNPAHHGPNATHHGRKGSERGSKPPSAGRSPRARVEAPERGSKPLTRAEGSRAQREGHLSVTRGHPNDGRGTVRRPRRLGEGAGGQLSQAVHDNLKHFGLGLERIRPRVGLCVRLSVRGRKRHHRRPLGRRWWVSSRCWAGRWRARPGWVRRTFPRARGGRGGRRTRGGRSWG